MRPSRIVFGVALAMVLSTGAKATEFNKLTYVTFNAPIQVPGVTLPAGTYRFELANPATARDVLRISSQDGTQHYAQLFTIPTERSTATDNVVMMFRETPKGVPAAVQAWFYPGERMGEEFVYPQQQAMRIAKATHQSVLATPSKGAHANIRNKVSVKRINPTASHRSK